MYFKGIITGLLLAVYFQLFRISNGWVNDAWYIFFFNDTATTEIYT